MDAKVKTRSVLQVRIKAGSAYEESEATVCATTKPVNRLPDPDNPAFEWLGFRYIGVLSVADIRAINTVLRRLGFDTFAWDEE